MTVRRVTAAEAVAVHDAAIRMFGGAGGVRDEGALESALAQPFQAFGGEDLYPGVADKAPRTVTRKSTPQNSSHSAKTRKPTAA